MERIDDRRMARRVLVADVSGGWVRGRPTFGCIDDAKVALGCEG